MNIIGIKEAISHIFQACEDKNINELPFFFIVGAGVSYPSIKLARDIVEDCKGTSKRYGREGALDSNASKVEEYSYWFERAYPHKEDRQKYLRKLIESQPISHANLRLAHILASTKVTNLLITPNFDDFVSRSLNIFGCSHLICDHPQTIAKIDPEKHDIQIVHVHGTYWFYDCCNLKGEIEQRAESGGLLTMSSFLDRTLSRRSPLVVGYSGWENDVIMTALKRRLENPTPLRYNLYWFCYTRDEQNLLPSWLKKRDDVVFVLPPESKRSERSTELLDKESSEIKEKEERLTALEVFEAITKEFKIEIPEIFTDPLGFMIKSLGGSLPKTSEDKGKYDEIYFINNVIERLKKAKEFDEVEKERRNEAEKLLDEIKVLVGKSLDEELLERINIEEVSRLDTKYKVELFEIVWSVLVKKNAKSNLLLKGYNFIGSIGRQIQSDSGFAIAKVNERVVNALVSKASVLKGESKLGESLKQCDEIIAEYKDCKQSSIREQVVRAMFIKALILGSENGKKDILVYDEIIEEYSGDNQPSVKEWVVKAMVNKAIILGEEDSEQSIIICDEVKAKYGEDKESDIKGLVAKAMINKAFLLEREDIKQAIAVYNEVIGTYKTDKEPDIRGTVARAMGNKATLVEEEDIKQAIAVYNEVIETYKTDKESDVREQVARAMVNKAFLLEREDIKQAIAVYNEVIETYKTDKEPYIRGAVARAMVNKAYLIEREDIKQAIAVYNEVIETYKTDKEPYIRGAVARAMGNKAVLIEEEDIKQAIVVYNEVIETYKTDKEPDVRGTVARAMVNKAYLIEREDIKQAIAVYNEVIETYKTDKEPDVRGTVARAMGNKAFLIKREDIKRAIAVYNEVIETYKTDKEPDIRGTVARAMGNKAVFIEREDIKQAIAVYNEVIETYKADKEPDVRGTVAKAMVNKAVLLEREDIKQAIAVYNEVIETYKTDEEPDIRGTVARAMGNKAVLIEREDIKQAIAVYNEVIEVYKTDKEPDVREQVARAMYYKGEILINSKETDIEDIKDGQRCLSNALEYGNSRAGVTLGMVYYSNCDYQSATECFYKSYLLNDSIVGINLAYMMRRGEAKRDLPIPKVDELLSIGIKANEPFALTNYALCLASGFQYPENWKLADQVIATISDTDGIIDWWYNLKDADKAEKNLVIGWLVRNKLIDDPDGATVAERMQIAKDGGWNVPDWMFSVADN